MKTLLKTSLALAVALTFLVIPEFVLGGPPRSPYGGIGHPTYSSLREKQRSRSYQARRYAPIRYMESRQSSSCELAPSSRVRPDDKVIIRTKKASWSTAPRKVADFGKWPPYYND